MTASVAAAAALIVFGVVMPAFREGSWGHASRFGPLADPRTKLRYLAMLLLGLGMLPLAGWRALLSAIPLAAVNLATSHQAQYSLKYHYDDQLSAFLMVAAIHGAAHILSRPSIPPLLSTKPWVGGAAAAAVVGSMLFVLGDAYPEQWRQLAKMNRSAELRRELAVYVDAPRTVAIATQSGLGPYLCHRDRYVSLAGDASDAALRDGDLIVLSPHAGTTGLDFEAARERFRSDRRAEPVTRTDVLEVWRWRTGPPTRE